MSIGWSDSDTVYHNPSQHGQIHTFTQSSRKAARPLETSPASGIELAASCNGCNLERSNGSAALTSSGRAGEQVLAGTTLLRMLCGVSLFRFLVGAGSSEMSTLPQSVRAIALRSVYTSSQPKIC
jgi:hypothetical protein